MAGDSFLSDPSKKRKRSKVTSTTRKTPKQTTTPAPEDDDLDSELESDENVISENEDDELSSSDEFADENAADKRRRLAKQYLDNLKTNEFAGEFNDFDAQDLDDDILARRLQVDVAENKGYVYKFVGDKVAKQFGEDMAVATTRIGSRNMTGVSARYPFLYTVSKDAELIKWNIAGKKPQRIKHIKGGARYFKLNTANPNNNHHWDQINCVAVSPDSKYVVTGGTDSRLIIWSSENLVCLKVLDTRSAVNAITFKRNSDQLYAACSDLKIRTFSINQFTQLEILYGHQDNIVDISALLRETCVSVGSRDKTAMFWKISEETRLTFRAGDSTEKKRRRDDDSPPEAFYNEGSLEVVSMLDESHFLTGSDNGNVALWSLAKKKALFTQRLAHGLQPALATTQASSETSPDIAAQQIPPRQPYWITAIHGVPFSDIFITGSFNGVVKIWKLDQQGLRTFELIGEIADVKGCVVKIDSVEVPETKKLMVFVLISKEPRFGRWLGKIDGGRNALVSFSFDI